MMKKKCLECGKDAWHNTTGSGKEVGTRCTYCGFPLGTGPKRERNAATHARQVAAARQEVK